MNLHEGIIPFDRDSGIHDQVSIAVAIERDGQRFPDLRWHIERETVNHGQGHDLDVLLQVEASLGGPGVPEHAAAFDAVVDYVTERVARERREGQCLGEVLASYWALSALYRFWTLRVALRLLSRLPAHGGLRRLIGELVAWGRIHRTLVRRLQAGNGLVHHPGNRLKHHSELNEAGHVLAHAWELPVTDPRILGLLRALVESPTPAKIRNSTHAVIASRLYRFSPEAKAIEAMTRVELAGRLSTPVGVHRGDDGSLEARMPRVRVTHESKDRRTGRPMPPQVVFEVALDGQGRLVERVATNGLAFPPGTMVEMPEIRPGEVAEHPDPARRFIPDGWEMFGPETPLPEAPPYTGEGWVPEEGDEEPSPPPLPPPPVREFLAPSEITWQRVSEARLHSLALLKAAAALAERELARAPVGGTDNPELARLVTSYRDRFRPTVLRKETVFDEEDLQESEGKS